ncbi:MAG: CvpA family protein [Eubacteriales bacterium]|nr:CvpA family protein [Eubacteriales bacterium]
MNIYSVIILIVAVIVLMSCMTHGFHKGLVHEMDALFSLTAAALCITLIAGTVSGLLEQQLSSFFIGLVLLAAVVFLYKIFHLLFSSIGIIVRLPVIRWLDKGLGLFVGLAEGFVLLYIGEYLLVHYLLA